MSSIPFRWSSRTLRAMTMIELIVTIAILSAVTTSLMKMIQSFYKDNSYLIEQTAALDSSRRGVDSAIVTLREASYGDDGSYPLANAATSSITVYADTDKDAAVERVRYSLVNGVLYRAVTNAAGTPPVYSGAQATTTIATNVRNTATTPVFTYYDSDGTQLSTTTMANAAAIASVKVLLLVDLNPNRAPNVFTFSQSATLRNIEKQ